MTYQIPLSDGSSIILMRAFDDPLLQNSLSLIICSHLFEHQRMKFDYYDSDYVHICVFTQFCNFRFL